MTNPMTAAAGAPVPTSPTPAPSSPAPVPANPDQTAPRFGATLHLTSMNIDSDTGRYNVVFTEDPNGDIEGHVLNLNVPKSLASLWHAGGTYEMRIDIEPVVLGAMHSIDKTSPAAVKATGSTMGQMPQGHPAAAPEPYHRVDSPHK